MTRPIRSIVSVAAYVNLAGVMGGCSSSHQVTFTNVSESWLDLRFFVGTGQDSNELVSQKKFQVEPGETTQFSVSRKIDFRGETALVHLQVQAVKASWERESKRYWMELITEGSIKIVARGSGDKLSFETGSGEVARIPSKALKRKYEYRIAGAVPNAEP